MGRRGIIFPRSPRPIAGIPALPPTQLRGLPNIQVSFDFLLSFDGLIIARLPGNVKGFFPFFEEILFYLHQVTRLREVVFFLPLTLTL